MVTDIRHNCLILEVVVISYNDILIDMVIDYISDVNDYFLLKSLFSTIKTKLTKTRHYAISTFVFEW